MMLENKNKVNTAVSTWAHPEFDPWESRDSGSKANETIDRLIGINDIKIGNEGYFKNNILESLLRDRIASYSEEYNPNLKDLIDISFGGQFGKDKNWGLDARIGSSSHLESSRIEAGEYIPTTWDFNLSKKF